MRHDDKADKNLRAESAGGLAGDGENCSRWEAILVDLLDGNATAEDEAAFRRHAEECEPCRTLLRESDHGREWARMLHAAPAVVPEDLLGKILAHTASNTLTADHTQTGPDIWNIPMPAGEVLVLPAAAWTIRGQRQARLLMTAAMAFFSIALTLSMTGLGLNDVRTPSALGVSASRQFFDTKKQVVSFYDNLRLVREVEATVQDLRHTANIELEKNKRAEHPQPSARRIPDALPLRVRNTVPLDASPRMQAEERTTL